MNHNSATANERTNKVADVARILHYLKSQDGIMSQRRGATCEEVEIALNIPHQTCSARFRDMSRSGQIVDSGLTLLTIRKCPATVWVVKPAPDEPQTRLL